MKLIQRIAFIFAAVGSAMLWLYWGMNVNTQVTMWPAWYERSTFATIQFATAASLFVLQTILMGGLLLSVREKLDVHGAKALALMLIGAYSTHFLAGVIAVLSSNSLVVEIIWLITLILCGILAFVFGIYLWQTKFSRWLRVSGASLTSAVALALFIEPLALGLIIITFVAFAVYFLPMSEEPEII